MPELPEVETVRRTLQHFVLGHEIQSVEILYPPIVNGDRDLFTQALSHEHLLDIDRRGKYLLFRLDHYVLLSHLRMEGKYLYEPSTTPVEKHSHVIFHLDGGMDLRYHDVRKFGRMELKLPEEVDSTAPIKDLGPDPFDMDEKTLYQLCRQAVVPIKVFLLDQSKMAGIGNIYANEICYRAGWHPLSRACDLSKKDVACLLKASQDVLHEAIEMGGTTIRSFSSNGIHGLFTQRLDVHGRDGESCHRCGHTITKMTIAQRTAYFCPNCQRRKRTRVKT